MKELKSFKEEDYDSKLNLSGKVTDNTDYFKPFNDELFCWKEKHKQATIMLEFIDLFNAIYKKGLKDVYNKAKKLGNREIPDCATDWTDLMKWLEKQIK